MVLCAEEGIPEEWLARSEALTGLSRPAQTWWSKWDGMTVAKMMTPESADYRHRLFSSAEAGDWPELFELLAQRDERNAGYTINAVRPNDSTWYTFLHYAALANAPGEVAEKLLSKGHFRSIRCAAGERPVDLAKRLGHAHLLPLLEPTRKHDIPEEKLAPIQDQFHQLISEELSSFDRQHLRLPPLEVLLERDDLTMTFFLPSKFGGFVFRLQQVARPEGFDSTRNDWVLLAKNFDRMGDTEYFYVVTRYGYQLMSKGHEDAES